jgi:hypothetical protein
VTLEEALVAVWRQVMAEQANEVELEGRRYPVRRTPRLGLRQVDFVFGDRRLRALEQNPATRSRWAAPARRGHRVLQFLSGGRYVAVVVDGRVHFYGRRPEGNPAETL